MKNIQLKTNQTGLVSFFVVVIIMIVLSLIVLAFSQLVRREQRQTLDRQLSTQAFYAAESGVNDALEALPALLAAGTAWADDCNGFISAAGASIDPDLGGGISYSCLLVDPAPEALTYGNVRVDQSTTVPLQAAGGVALSSLEISWDDPDGGPFTACPQPTGPVGGSSFPGGYEGAYADCAVGGLRLELVPFALGSTRTRDQLISERFVAFVQPRPGSPLSVAYADGAGPGGERQGIRSVGGCDAAATSPRCTVRITGLTTNRYYLRMRSLYSPTTVTIRGRTGGGAGTPVDLVGAQVEVDVTGRANDVLRRIKVNRPIGAAEGVPAPEFAAQSADTLCKRFSIAPAPAGGTHLLDWDDTSPGATAGQCNPTN